jgi:hypothetical protein
LTIIGGNARLNYDVFGRVDQVGVMPEARRRAIRRLRGMLAATGRLQTIAPATGTSVGEGSTKVEILPRRALSGA